MRGRFLAEGALLRPSLAKLAATSALVFAASGLSLPAAARSRQRKVVRKVRVTGYCVGPCRECGTQGITSTGTRTLRGVAVARRGRRVVPLGSRLYIPGYGAARVDDVGGGVGPTQIDLRFKSHRRAARWGSRRLEIVAILSRR